MHHIQAIGFDLFNTMLTIDPWALEDGEERLMASLTASGISVEKELFKDAYRESALRFLNETRQDGRETHNRFWISAALRSQGYDVGPDDPRIAAAVTAYFSAFMGRCLLIPGTMDIIKALKGSYRLGMLSNFTHPPAIREIIDSLGLTPHFDAVLISGELGYRKPHPLVFHHLIQELGITQDEILYVGDDPEADIMGAKQAGIRPVWFTYVRDKKVHSSPGITGRAVQDPEEAVMRISNWAELTPLLDTVS
jgi:putative hydrolase of the HAD superfamily